jgi:hypothetical protein
MFGSIKMGFAGGAKARLATRASAHWRLCRKASAARVVDIFVEEDAKAKIIMYRWHP